ncbi:hypothetical protein LEP1GSC051_2152 [Leptospira sp. P2653]|nr:hypothetical protein LEP1GSC051_2152 [Leptospira sp. P2653]
MLWIELKSDALRKVSKVRTGGSHFLFNDATLKYNSVSDRSGNPATQHVLNAETGIYEKFAMLRCRLKRRARPIAKRRGTLSLAKTKMTEVESKIADACDKMKGFEKKES